MGACPRIETSTREGRNVPRKDAFARCLGLGNSLTQGHWRPLMAPDQRSRGSPVGRGEMGARADPSHPLNHRHWN
jgi:hypothetical protein